MVMAKTPYILGASVIGQLHIKLSLPCQDSFASDCFPDGLGVIAVADGLGSVKKADIGADTAVMAAIERVNEIYHKNNDAGLEEIAREAFFNARKKLEAKAEKINSSLRELATTLIVVAIKEDNISVAHIGDGAVVAKTENGLVLASAPAESEYANIVEPITSNHWEQSLRISPLFSGVDCLAVFTDGIQRASLLKSKEGLQPYDKFFDPIFSYAIDSYKENQEIEHKPILELLSSQKLRDNSDDDKTLVIALTSHSINLEPNKGQ